MPAEEKSTRVNASSPETLQTPDVVGKLIRYALSGLSKDNAHHEFEHLCRHIARRRICSNIIPATGPVSGGGDKGADFESLPVQSGFGTSRYWRLVAQGKVLFACSIEKNLKKKIKADVKAAAEFGEPLERMYFFYNDAISVGSRNKFKEAALKEHGVNLEIVDGEAIAEFLADPELLWVAEKYLSLPSAISLPSHGTAPPWYSSLLTTPEADLTTNSDTFYQLKSAVRYASGQSDRHSDVPKLIRRLLLFRSHSNRTVARKAFYEEFVAMLRGLDAAEGYEPQVIKYLSEVGETDDPAELEDAAIILSYANGACNRGILKIEASVRRKFRDELLARLDSLIGADASFVTCSLLFTKGHLLLISAALDGDPDGSAPFPWTKAADDAVEVWNVLLRHSRDIPLFPVERLRSQANFLFPYVTSDRFTAFLRKLDGITAERAGMQSLAEEYVTRASALLAAGDHIRSLQTFHEALRLSQSLESQSEAIAVCLQLSALYEHLGLYHAAKYYGLAASYAALRLPEDALRKMAAVGLAAAAKADYATGASLLFFLTFKMFVVVAQEFAIAGRKSFRDDQWATVDFYAMLLTRASKIISGGCHSLCQDMLRRLDAQDIYAAGEEELEKTFAGLDRAALAARYAEEGIATPFSDFARSRMTCWRQFGIKWLFEWPSTYEAERHGQALCTVVQIVLAALAGTEFSIIATEVTVVLETSQCGEPKVKQIADNDVLRFAVVVDPSRAVSLDSHLAIVYDILAICSAIPTGEFQARFEEEFRRGLPHRIGVYVSPAEVFRQFYTQSEYEELHEPDAISDTAERVDIQPTRTRKEVSDTSELHPQYNESEALRLIENRYRRSAEMFPHTLRALSSDAAFQRVVSKLNESGWKDWHILLAVGNIRINSLIDVNDANYKEAVRMLMWKGERPEDPLPSVASFDEERLRDSLRMSQPTTIANMGFRVDQMTPNFPGIDAFLTRFKYWDLDVPHPNPFRPD
jgi:hypothetical protein